MPRFQKKPVVIDAVQWTGKCLRDARKLYEELGTPGFPALNQNGSLMIETLEGTMEGRKGDWIIKGIKGEIYPCKPEIFSATYEAV